MKPDILTELTRDPEATIKICSDHQDKERTPLIWTFAFPYNEYWCPYCGWVGGMLGAGDNVKSTPKLRERLAEYEKSSKQFLHAKGMESCIWIKYKGKKVAPEDLPKRSRDFWRRKAESWIYQDEI